MPLILACLLYAGAMIAANLSIAAFGPWVSPINSFLLIGLDLTLRDRLHDAWSGRGLRWKMPILILVSALATYLLNPAAAQIAIASALAFGLAAATDGLVYHRLRTSARWGEYLRRTNGSNAAGAMVDSIAFPTIAFGVLMPHIIAMQFVAKVAGGFVWSLILRRAVIEAR
jgi:hypothetical protein